MRLMGTCWVREDGLPVQERCIKKLQCVRASHPLVWYASAGSALVALMQHMQKLPARSDCRNHLFVLSSSLAACVGNPKMQRVLQVGRQVPQLNIRACLCTCCCLRSAQSRMDTCPDMTC